jgi:predicted component of viral defense system (DUF524 family)
MSMIARMFIGDLLFFRLRTFFKVSRREKNARVIVKSFTMLIIKRHTSVNFSIFLDFCGMEKKMNLLFLFSRFASLRMQFIASLAEPHKHKRADEMLQTGRDV